MGKGKGKGKELLPMPIAPSPISNFQALKNLIAISTFRKMSLELHLIKIGLFD